MDIEQLRKDRHLVIYYLKDLKSFFSYQCYLIGIIRKKKKKTSEVFSLSTLHFLRFASFYLEKNFLYVPISYILTHPFPSYTSFTQQICLKASSCKVHNIVAVNQKSTYANTKLKPAGLKCVLCQEPRFCGNRTRVQCC